MLTAWLKRPQLLFLPGNPAQGPHPTHVSLNQCCITWYGCPMKESPGNSEGTLKVAAFDKILGRKGPLEAPWSHPCFKAGRWDQVIQGQFLYLRGRRFASLSRQPAPVFDHPQGEKTKIPAI